ncbi:hypothetical protein [Scopulibacillus cellulosilyticus]|uniref:DUF4359 domain-containing protein n=1 Tax=Scopulibacillus cellulosilyticus TaxID=2665665 RepID=A0ABW2PRG7_9BACL
MKKRNILLFITICMMVIAIATNPSRSEYIGWLKEKTADSPVGKVDRGIVTLISKKALRNTTTTKDYGIFSVYITSTKKDSMIALGVFNHFIPIDK